MATINKTRTFGGKTFSLKRSAKTAGAARKFAEKQRSEGKNARIVRADGKYHVFTCSRSARHKMPPKPSTSRKPGQQPIGSYGRAVTRKVSHQTGKTNRKRDKNRDAMAPGYRRSASGKTYYETRKNRSDLRGRV